MADSFLRGVAWALGSVWTGPTNDGADTSILPLEDVTAPPKFDYRLTNIVSQWQPELRLIFVAPRGNEPAADTPLPRQTYLERENGIQWQQSWNAQSRAPNAAWNFANPIPSQTYREIENGIQWQQTWSAQRAAPNAAWNTTVAADNPPPLKAYPLQVNAAWQPNLVLISVSPRSGESVAAVDAPPPRQEYAEQRVAAMWAQNWNAQQRAPNASWNFTPAVVDNPPPRKAYPHQVNAAWQPNLVLTQLAPRSGESVAAPPAPGDDPTPQRPYLSQLIAGHFHAAISVITVRAASEAVQPDDPPQTSDVVWLTIVAGQWQQAWRAQRAAPNASWNFTPVQIDNPPPRNEYRERENGLPWALNWSAQQRAPVAAWTVPSAVVDNPPPRQLFGVREVVVQWQQNWSAQHVAPNAGWNFTLPDNPPPRNEYCERENGLPWQQNWYAQKAAPNAAWNIPPIDNPPGRRPQLAAGVHGAWVVTWKSQRAGPVVQPGPEIVPVYGWGARSKVGSRTGRDVQSRIGSGSAKAQNGKIGSEDA